MTSLLLLVVVTGDTGGGVTACWWWWCAGEFDRPHVTSQRAGEQTAQPTQPCVQFTTDSPTGMLIASQLATTVVICRRRHAPAAKHHTTTGVSHVDTTACNLLRPGLTLLARKCSYTIITAVIDRRLGLLMLLPGKLL